MRVLLYIAMHQYTNNYDDLYQNRTGNAKIVAANFSCSAKVGFVEEKRWLCQGIEVPCNALVFVLF